MITVSGSARTVPMSHRDKHVVSTWMGDYMYLRTGNPRLVDWTAVPDLWQGV